MPLRIGAIARLGPLQKAKNSTICGFPEASSTVKGFVACSWTFCQAGTGKGVRVGVGVKVLVGVGVRNGVRVGVGVAVGTKKVAVGVGVFVGVTNTGVDEGVVVETRAVVALTVLVVALVVWVVALAVWIGAETVLVTVPLFCGVTDCCAVLRPLFWVLVT